MRDLWMIDFDCFYDLEELEKVVEIRFPNFKKESSDERDKDGNSIMFLYYNNSLHIGSWRGDRGWVSKDVRDE